MSNQVYGPLGPKSIRLLSIVPGFASETINCSLTVVDDRDQAPEYDAISYVWGSNLSDEPITCNGQRMVVTENLIEAMRYLRPLPSWDSVITWPENHPLHSSHNVWRGFATNRQEEREHSASQQQRPIWIDALCINQLDKAEKENQVKLMDRIYANATTVKIWLGGARSFQMYGRMPVVLAFVAQALRNVRAGEDYPTAARAATDATYRNSVHGFPIATAEEWKVLYDFFDNPWFERIWVVQEVVHAKQAIAILGDWHVELAALGEAARWFQAHGFGLPSNVKYTGDTKDLLPVAKLAAMWQMHCTPGKRSPLLQMLRDLRGRKSTLKVDKVYAAYSLAEETAETEKLNPLIEPTYDHELVNEVYQNMVRFLVINHGNLAALSHAGGIQGVKTLDQLPSWVPDWSQGKESVELIDGSQDDTPYNADGGENLVIGDSIDPRCFSVKGIRIPTRVIRAYGDRLISYGFRHTTYKEERDFVKSAWSLIAHLANKGNSIRGERLEMYQPENIPRTFVSTLTAGLTNIRKPVDEDPGFLDDAANWMSKQFGGRIPVSGISKKPKWQTALWNSSNSGRFHETFTRVCLHRRFFITTENLMGIGPETMEKDDIIVILFGGKVPYVVRELGENEYSFIGECYVPGLMFGEAVKQWRESGRKANFFNLV
ncbi:heterokaryon incompatibility protein-domain-containing protein [Hypoxylon trugodes]|uniref:heterokaryon incompatibility protein-domain-containing protein n=1 Tax=Hypoxylon trugodes TaxID=326681 RepID=UPI00219D4905|nr:heterokaryon incompatibility protein-domain-containing protein [Hypoxylon trugodes]KAI1387504.1 heterokaryon incompatibility protein-domain-containing protein [Hypoxylon trugodes]